MYDLQICITLSLLVYVKMQFKNNNLDSRPKYLFECHRTNELNMMGKRFPIKLSNTDLLAAFAPSPDLHKFLQ